MLFYEPRKDLEALSCSNKIDKTGYIKSIIFDKIEKSN